MRKLLTIILCMFLSANNFVYAADENVNSIDKNVESLKDALNGALDLPSKTPLFIVKVRRRVGDKEVQTPLISHSECEQLLRLLYSLCSKQDAPKYSDGGVAFNKKFNTSAKEDELAKVDELCRELAAYRAKINGACTLVVFNEALFSQDPPLTTNQKNFILEQLKLLSSSAPNTVFYPNFLFTEMRGNTREQAKEARKEMKNNLGLQEGKAMARMTFKKFNHYSGHPLLDSEAKTMRVFKNKSNNEICRVRYLLNETFSVHSGEVITAYKKFTYFDEHNKTMNTGCLYDFGEGKDVATDVSEGQKKLQKVLLENISTETCFDLAYGVRYNNWWTNLTKPSKLHIIPSNSITAFGRNINDNARNLPVGVGIINVDSYLDRRPDAIPYCKTSQRPKLHDNDVDEKINLVAYLTDTDNKSYEVVIGDSRYIITVCKIR